MPKNTNYRKQLLLAIEAFLEGTPASRVRAHDKIQRCSLELESEDKKWPCDQLLWSSLFKELSDSVFNENDAFLQETRELLMGRSSRALARTVLTADYRIYFTPDEMEWYSQLLDLIDFIRAVPFKHIHEATGQFWRDRTVWAKMSKLIPEASQAKELEEMYLHKKVHIENVSARCVIPESMGNEKIYQIVLREVTDLIAGLDIGSSAVFFGYPIIGTPYSAYGDELALPAKAGEFPLNATNSLFWSKQVLEALAGNGGLFALWHVRRGATLGNDTIIISAIYPLAGDQTGNQLANNRVSEGKKGTAPLAGEGGQASLLQAE